jgi:hypothetical protein
MKNKVTIAAHLKNGICRGFKKYVDEENVKCQGRPSNATNKNWKNVIRTPDCQ